MLSRAHFFHAAVERLEKLVGHLDLVRQQREALVAQAFDLLHRSIGAQQILVAQLALLRIESLLLLGGQLLGRLLRVEMPDLVRPAN